jgi:tRNA dimethylallyltransferase
MPEHAKAHPPLVVLVGPTASGKTALALALAEELGGEIVGADSRQIYRGMDIGTAKPTLAERRRVLHHLIDVVDPDEPFTLADYQRQAVAAIRAVQARGRLPLLVGGTGLYIRAVVDGLIIPSAPPDPAQRRAWEDLAAQQGPAALHALLAERDPQTAEAIPPANVRRVIRALEVCLATGQPFSAQQRAQPPDWQMVHLALTTERQRLYAWADARVDAMLAAGLVEEVQRLVASGYGWQLPAMSSLGYRQIGAYLRGEMTLAAAIERLKFDTHGFIRKQLIWFRADARLTWLDAADTDLCRHALDLVREGPARLAGGCTG